jgi:hypothetical protein
MMDRAQHGQALPLDRQQPVAQALVVVHEIEVVAVVGQPLGSAHRKGEGFGKAAHRERGDLGPVGQILDLPQPGHSHRDVVVIDVEAG